MSIVSLLALIAIDGTPFVRYEPAQGGFPLIKDGVPATVMVDSQDWPGVQRASKDLQKDLERVSQNQAKGPKVMVGTLGKSPTIDALVQSGKLDVAAIKGQWEASVTQVVGDTLVVAGADKRGTIYALYDLCEAAGVSPWNWWADVPIKRHKDVFIKGKRVAKSPAVKYRGIFLNDEAPALTNWVLANYGGYNHQFYEKVFELLLRLRANTIWPAMWNNCFSQDDPLNPQKADEYGIVMGTSHVEPMLRADKEWNRLGFGEKEWNYATHPQELEKFWTDGVNRNKPYESITTIAMRGKIDTPMSETANIELLEKIVAAQRKILAENVNPDLTQIPQVWCLYKEVQEYYEKGMRVPDDVTLLWSDDNWGNIRRLPTPQERSRKGGAGVYYHFDYVGGPRNYKWINTSPITKIWEQMSLAYRYGADQIWIVNVGDLKPMEFPLEFFMTLARDPDAIGKDDLKEYTRRWAAREFGSEHAKEIAAIINATERLNGRRKPELIDAKTYSLSAYSEAESVVAEYRALTQRAETLGKKLPKEAQSAFFQLVLHPVKAPAIVNELHIETARNALYAKQGRAQQANRAAARVKALFAADAALQAEYHGLNGGKWNHVMDQTHISYTYWQQPEKDVLPALVEPEVSGPPALGVATTSLHFTRYGARSQRVDVFNQGSGALTAQVTASAPWIVPSVKRVSVPEVGPTPNQDPGFEVHIDWSKAAHGMNEGSITVTSFGLTRTVRITAENLTTANLGFVEGDGVIAIEADHTSRRTIEKKTKWVTLPGYGRHLSAVTPSPSEFVPFAPGAGPCLEYGFAVLNGGRAKLEFVLSPTLAFQPGRGLRLAYAIDRDAPKTLDVAANYLSRDWEESVIQSVRRVQVSLSLAHGRHTLKVWAIDPGVVLERIVIDLGGLKPSSLGPPESHRIR